jgi:hypothetical protein
MTGEIARKGDKAPIQAGQRWPIERTNAWHNSFNRLQRCYERKEEVIDAFFEATVKTHLLNIYAKLGVSDRAAAVAEAFNRGLLTRRS